MSPFLGYLIPTNLLFKYLSYEMSLVVAYCLVAFIFLVAAILGVLVGTRNTKNLTTESPERKLVNKTVGLVISITYYVLFVPVSTFSSNFLYCNPAVQGTCF